ncbi:MAG: hypothetical protein LC796_01345 [Acidobacteria bacterium]|nr:hypothetical protein [Acidobacteriota bacterium]MCA1610190.1 hypothetical protein [Acidobacteriota bacterium]
MAALLAALLLLASACARRSSRNAGRLPAGDTVWLRDGSGEAGNGAETGMTRAGFASVFLPAATLTHTGGVWTAAAADRPPEPFRKLPVTLVLSVLREAPNPLADPAGAAALADALWIAAKPALQDAAAYGRVRGVHLDVPFAASAASAWAKAVEGFRARLPRSMLLTWTVPFTPADAEKEAFQKIIAATDGAVAVVFGEGAASDPAIADRLGAPWLAGYSLSARGRSTPAGKAERALPESVFARLTDDPGVEFSHDLSLKDDGASSFLLTPHQPVTAGGVRFAPGERVVFRQPSVSDFVYRFGADLAGRRSVKGRVVIVSGRAEADRIFTLAALNDVLLGRPLNADLRVTLEPGRGGVAVTAENPTPNASVVSRTSNWVEVDLPSGGISDVRAGGFDRFEVFGPDGQPVTLGRATRVRFFETLVGPGEKIEPARIVLRKPPPRDCCAHRIHVISSAGPEVAREGS